MYLYACGELNRRKKLSVKGGSIKTKKKQIETKPVKLTSGFNYSNWKLTTTTKIVTLCDL